MRLELTNPNYNATVVRVRNILPLKNCDNIVGLQLLGMQALVSKDVELDSLGILFSTEVELSDDFCSNNNLYRHSHLNKDVDSKGYIEDNRRVKAIKFRGHTSNSLFMPLSCLSYLNIPYNTLKEGDIFNEIDGKEICKKYVIERKTSGDGNRIRGKNKLFELIDNKTFPEHLDTDNYFRYSDKIKDEDYVYISQKLHGTSIRLGNNLRRKPQKRWQKLFGIQKKEYGITRGSRRVIKNGYANKTNQNFYANDIWKAIADRYGDVIPQDWIVYGEIVGRDGEKAIQPNYTYGLPKGDMELYVYRIAVVNQQGISADLPYIAMKEFCENNGLKVVPLLWEGKHKEFVVEDFMDKKYAEMGYKAVPLSIDCPCDEGVVVRKEGIMLFLLKAKCSTFLEHESKQLDKGEVDTESLDI